MSTLHHANSTSADAETTSRATATSRLHESLASGFHAAVMLEQSVQHAQTHDATLATSMRESLLHLHRFADEAMSTAMTNPAMAVGIMDTISRQRTPTPQHMTQSLVSLGMMFAAHGSTDVSLIPMLTTLDGVRALASRPLSREQREHMAFAMCDVGKAEHWTIGETPLTTHVPTHEQMVELASGYHGARLVSRFGPYEAGCLLRDGEVPPSVAVRVCGAVCSHLSTTNQHVSPSEDAGDRGWWSLCRTAAFVQARGDSHTALIIAMTTWAAHGCPRARQVLEQGMLLT
jgi:hypothetical protein